MVFGTQGMVVSAWWLEASGEWIVDGRCALRGGWGPTSVLYWASGMHASHVGVLFFR